MFGVRSVEAKERNVELRQNSSRPVVQSGDNRLCVTGGPLRHGNCLPTMTMA